MRKDDSRLSAAGDLSLLGADPRLQELMWADPSLARRRAQSIDATTGLASRDAFATALARQMATSPVALLVFDLDGFGQINAVCGQEVGDRVLGDVALALARNVRSTDLVGRIGADSFGVAMPSEAGPHLRAIAARLLDAIAQVAPPSDPTFAGVLRLRLHACVGVAVSRHGERVESVIARAGEALRAAQRHPSQPIDIAA